MRKGFFAVFVFLSAMFCALPSFALQSNLQAISDKPKAILLNVDGAIGPASKTYIENGLKTAVEKNARVVVLQLNTPGGLSKSMRDIIKVIIASPIPVITYVAPGGARAASAGTYILYASHVAAMAPGTNLGAATPVALGMPGVDKDKKSKPSAMSKKAISDARAYIRSLAQLRDRNVKWAEKSVLKADSLSAEEAKKHNVINIVASNLTEVFDKADGMKISLQGREHVLQTKGLMVEKFAQNWHVKFLSIITDPSFAYLLMIIGVWGIFFEFANPGFVVPGVVGVICLMIAAYAFQLLPINYVGLGLILFGIVFMVAEAFVPSFGALGLGGIIAFAVGSVMLLEPGTPGYAIAMPMIVAVSGVSALFFLVIIRLALKSRFRPVVSGREELIGSTATLEKDMRVRIRGEMWQTHSDEKLAAGQKIKVIDIDGLVLIVEREDS